MAKTNDHDLRMPHMWLDTIELLRLSAEIETGPLHVLRLWDHLRSNHTDGWLIGYSPESIEAVCRWRGERRKLWEALVASGVLSGPEGNNYYTHWERDQPWVSRAQERSDEGRACQIRGRQGREAELAFRRARAAERRAEQEHKLRVICAPHRGSQRAPQQGPRTLPISLAMAPYLGVSEHLGSSETQANTENGGFFAVPTRSPGAPDPDPDLLREERARVLQDYQDQDLILDFAETPELKLREPAPTEPTLEIPTLVFAELPDALLTHAEASLGLDLGRTHAEAHADADRGSERLPGASIAERAQIAETPQRPDLADVLELYAQTCVPAGLYPATRRDERALQRALDEAPERSQAWWQRYFARLASSPFCCGKLFGRTAWGLTQALGAVEAVEQGRYDRRDGHSPKVIPMRPKAAETPIAQQEEVMSRERNKVQMDAIRDYMDKRIPALNGDVGDRFDEIFRDEIDRRMVAAYGRENLVVRGNFLDLPSRAPMKRAVNG